jgi:ribosome-associated toxin RatA of RatAB toxin-antitoxin module
VARKRAERQLVIQASPQTCFEAVVDYESFPDWQRAVRACDVLSHDKRGRGERVSFEIDAKLKTIHYTLDYRYEEPHLVAWRYVEGDVRDVDGELVLEDTGDATTLATYALRVDPGVWLPGRVADMLSGQVMHGVLEDLKLRVEGARA